MKDEDYFEKHCYCCQKEIDDETHVEFTFEFDAWVCIGCYERITDGDFKNEEEEFMYEEWLL